MKEAAGSARVREEGTTARAEHAPAAVHAGPGLSEDPNASVFACRFGADAGDPAAWGQRGRSLSGFASVPRAFGLVQTLGLARLIQM